MDRHFEEFREQIEGLTGELCEMRLRLDTLEARVGAASGAEPEETPPPDLDVSQAEATARLRPTRTVPFIGRTLVALGGAFLLRAITDNALVPAVIGAAAGLMYAAWWLLQADRSAAAGLRQSAVFHGFATAMIAYPLIWETTVRFGLLGPNAAVAALLFLFALGLAVAWRRELWEIAWILTLFTVVTAIALAVGTREFLPFTTALLVSAVAVEALAYRDRWLGPRWPIALGLDLAVLILTSATLSSFGQDAGAAALVPGGVIAACMALSFLYLGSIAARTLLRGCPITPFEVAQAGAALLVGFSGAVRVIRVSGADPMFVGVVALVLGAACYAAALTIIDRRSGRGRNLYSYTAVAGLLVLTGSSMICGGVALALIWSALAVVTIGLGGRFDRITLKYHGAVYLGAAATVSELIVCAYNGLFADPTGAWELAKPVGIAVTLVAAICYGILIATPGETARPSCELLPQTFVAALVVWGVGGTVAGLASASILAAAGSEAGAAFVAASRTAVIAILAVTLAWSGRRWSLRELSWFTYPVLVMGGVKLLWEDLHYNQPVTLFLALALYGGALIVTPRLLRTSHSDLPPIEAD